MSEEDVIRIMQHPISMIETDGDPVSYGDGFPHPRSYGAFPRVLARYVRELGVLTLEEAIKKMTSMPADQYNQRERGRIQEGKFADLVIFDEKRVTDRSSFEDPAVHPEGVPWVLVNGEVAVENEEVTGVMAGEAIP